MRSTFAVAALLCLASCTDWPGEGQGGMAEFHDPSKPFDAVAAAESDPSFHDRYGRLRARIACEEARLDALRLESEVRSIYTGQVLGIEQTGARARRELAAGLYYDAAADADALADATTAAETVLLPAGRAHAGCPK